MGDSLVLRLRTSSGVKRLECLSGSSTFRSLLDAVSPFMDNLPANCIAVKSGFPPKRIEAAHTAALSALNLRAGEVLVAEETEPQEVPYTEEEMQSLANSSAIDAVASSRPMVGRALGGVVRRPVLADNSCLFTSVAWLLLGSQEHAQDLRMVCAQAVAADAVAYSEAVLDKPRESYAAWIVMPTSWGGAIELSILSKHFQTSIAVCDVQTSVVYRYEEESYKQRIYLIYDGIHYDPLVWGLPDSEEIDVRVFNPRDDAVEVGAKALAAAAQKNRAYVDTASFSLRCIVCGEGVVGNDGAVAHSAKTGHASYSEY